jgi:lysophospholipase L1-like esterase
MPLPTQPVTCRFNDQSGNPVAGARATFRLTSTEVYEGIVAPELVEATADATGECVVNLFPNALGVNGSQYIVKAWNPDTGGKFLDVLASVPNSPCLLHEIMVQEPYPPVDQAAAAMLAAQAALSIVTAERLLAEAAAGGAASSESVATSAAASAAASALAAQTSGSAVGLAARLASSAPSDGAAIVRWIRNATGAAAQWVSDKLSESLSVKDFGAVGNGVADDTVAASRQPTDQRLLPSGVYPVTSYSPWGLYGAGQLRFAGVDLPVPLVPQRANLLRAGLGSILSSRSPSNVNFITLIGDSIGAGYHTANRNEHWFSLFMDYLRAGEVGAAKTLDVVTLFNEPTRWDLTLAGTTTVGTEGPVQSSLRMTPGSTITYTGAYQFHEVFFQRAAGAGSLEFRFNGTLYKTISCAGATASDVFTFPSTQSSDVFGAHEIRCVGANVTVTGLWRAVQSTTLAEPYFLRAARPGWGTVSFTDADLDSLCRQAAPTGTDNGVFFIALGTNDMVNASVAQSPANYAVNLDRIIQRILRNQPKAAVYFITPTRMNFITWPIITAGANYYDYRAAAWEVCQSYGIPVLDIDSLMLLERGLISDGVHPDAPGHKLIAQFLAEQLQQRPPAAIRKNSTRTGNILIDSPPSFTSGTGLIGAFNGGQGYLYAQNVETGAPLPLNIAHLGGALTIGNGATTTLAVNVNSRAAASAGGFGAVPATVRAYIDVSVNGVDGCIPVFIRA